MKTLGLFLLALSAPAAAFATNPSSPEPALAVSAARPAAQAGPAAERVERLICRRSELTGQRTASRRVCRTAAQWRELDR